MITWRRIEKVGTTKSPASAASADEGCVADPRGDGPADDLDDERGPDGAAQAEPVEQPTAPRTRDRDGDVAAAVTRPAWP